MFIEINIFTRVHDYFCSNNNDVIMAFLTLRLPLQTAKHCSLQQQLCYFRFWGHAIYYS